MSKKLLTKPLLNLPSKGSLFVKLALDEANKGFTLVELLIAIVIIVILSTLGIASFNSANSRNELQNQAKEIQSLMRNLRTDSVAAVKPVTGAGTIVDPSCKSPNAGVSDQGTYYGAYITFNSTDYVTGVRCFGATGNIGGTPTTTDFASGITVTPPAKNTLFFSFDGDVYNFSGLPATETATNNALADPLNKVSSPISIKFTQDSKDYYIHLNGSGLICAQEEASGCAD